MTKQEQRKLVEIQSLIGQAQGAHFNDRDQNHIRAVADPLEKAFSLCLDLLGKYPPITEAQP